MPEYVKKICLIGDGAVGKTSLIRRFVLDKFSDEYIVTIGTKVMKKTVRITKNNEKKDFTFMVWDILGQTGYEELQGSALKGADGIFLVLDSTRVETAESLKTYWLPMITKSVGTVPMLLLANKEDLGNERKVSEEYLKNFSDEYKIPYFWTSAKTGKNVEEAFLAMADKLMMLTPVKDEIADYEKDIDAETLKTDIKNVFDVVDKIISDFCKSYGDYEIAMTMIRTQFEKAGIDIRNPTKNGIKKVIDMLIDTEKNVKSKDELIKHRLRWLSYLDALADDR